MKKTITVALLIMSATAQVHAATCCRVLDVFVGTCPTAKDLEWGSAAKDPTCVCTAGNPPQCRITDIFERCPDGSAAEHLISKCECTECTGGTTHPGGSTGCTNLPCTACVDTGWESNGTGYQVKKTGGTCSGNSCTSYGVCTGQTIEYRCASGWCGTTTDGKTGCTQVDSSLMRNCIVTNTFENECPDGVENCICTNTIPKKCTATDIFDTLPSWATSYGCGINYWVTTGNTGYEKNTALTVTDGTCIRANTNYRCASGYYGTTSNGSSGCTKCPSPGTSQADATIPTQCYVPSDTPQSEDSGNYIFTQDCYYTN